MPAAIALFAAACSGELPRETKPAITARPVVDSELRAQSDSAVRLAKSASAEQQAYGPAVSDAAAPAGGSWIVKESASEMDGTATVLLSVVATEPIKGWLEEELPILMVRCREKRTDVVVRTGMAANPELGLFQRFHVRLRFDQQQPVREVWSEATNNEALFSPSAINLARRITRADTLRFEFTPFNSSKAIAVFPVSGLKEILPRVAKACGWAV